MPLPANPRLAFAVALAGLLGFPALQEPPEQKPPQQAASSSLTAEEKKIVEANLDLISDPDPRVRKVARRTLLSFGARIKPLLRKRLERLGATELVDLLDEIEREEKVKVEPVQGIPEDLDPWFSSVPALVRPIPRRDADAYLLSRLQLALAAIAREEYDLAERMLAAIQLLDPSWMYADRVSELRRYAQRQILEGKVLKPVARPVRPAVPIGKPLEIHLTILNPFNHELTIQSQGSIVPAVHARVRVSILRHDGEQEAAEFPQVFEFPRKIVLPPGKSWSQTIRIDTKSEYQPKLMRVYQVHLSTRLLKIEGRRSMTRKILFPTVKAKVIPEKYEPYIADPLGSLERTMQAKGIDGGTVNEVFICLMLLEGSENFWRGIARFMKVFEKTEQPILGQVLVPMLKQVTGVHLEPTKAPWLKWWSEKKAALAKEFPLVEEFRE